MGESDSRPDTRSDRAADLRVDSLAVRPHLEAEPLVPTGRTAARSVLWSLSGSFGSAALVLFRSIVVARLIGPEEFGRFVLVATVLGLAEVATRPGLEVAALQQRELQARTLETVWTALVLRGLAITTVLLLLAEHLGDLLAAEDAVGLLKAIAVVPLVRSLTSMAVLAEARRVELGPQARVLMIGQLTETAVAVAGSAITGSAAALVVAVICGAAAEVAASWCTRGFRPRCTMRLADLWPLMRFSRWVFGSNVLAYLSTTLDDLVVGRFSGTRALGLYRAAYRLGNLPTTQISHAVAQVAMPMLSRLQDDGTPRQAEVFLRYLRLTSATAGILAGVIAVTAPDLVSVLLGAAWAQAATVLAILAVAGFVRAILACGGTLFTAGGRPQLDTAMQALRIVVLCVGLLTMLGPWGIEGAALASLLSVLATVPVWLGGLVRLGYSPAHLVSSAVRPLPPVLAASAGAALIGALIDEPLPSLLATGGSAVVSWIVLTALQPELRRELSTMVRHVRSPVPTGSP